jgi:hypothetical protein
MSISKLEVGMHIPELDNHFCIAYIGIPLDGMKDSRDGTYD